MVPLILLLALVAGSDAAFKQMPGKEDGMMPTPASNISDHPMWPPLNIDLPDWALEFTFSKTGCPCWFDMSMGATTCACCKNSGIQCGYPLHNYCQMKHDGIQRGCPGVPNSQYTLSTKGYPCNGDRDNRNCAWCSQGSFICHNAATMYQSSTCVPPMGLWENKCVGIPQDCGLVSKSPCSPDAMCVQTGMNVAYNSFKNYNTSVCACKSGYTGNGIDCADDSTGNLSNEMDSVMLEVKVQMDLYEGPGSSSFPTLSEVDNYMSYVDMMLAAGGVSGSGCTCNADVVSCS